MKRAKKKTLTRVAAGAIAGLLAGLMIFGLVADLFFRVSASAASQSDVDALKDKLEDQAAEKEKLQDELDSIDSEKATVKEQIEALDAQINNTEEQIGLQNELIDSLEEMIAQKEVELADAQKKEEEQYEKFKTRVRVMYEQGETSYLEVLLSADDLSDFLSKYEIVSQIAEYDKNLFEELKALKEDIAEKKAELEENREEAQDARKELEATKSELDSQMENRSQAMKQLESAAEDVKASFAEIEAEEDAINAQIDQIVKEMEAEAERKRQEQAAQGGSGSISTGTTQVGNYTYPLPSGYRTVSSKFGYRNHPVTGVYKLHTGVDISAPNGTAIYAAQPGTVIIAGYSSAWGNYVVINHGGGITTLYAHMSKILTTKGATVSAGEQIGRVGSTGYSTGNHLHFEVRSNGNYQDAGRILGLY